MKKFKKIKLRVPRIPENAKIMSLMAIILICAAPALVSSIDDSTTYSYDSVVPGNQEILKQYVTFDAETPADVVKTYSSVVSDTGLIGVLDSPSTAAYITYIDYKYDSSLIPTFESMVITSTSFQNVWLTMNYNGVVTTIGAFEQVSDGVFVYNLDSVEKVKLQSDKCTEIGFKGKFIDDASDSWTVDIGYATTEYIPYGEIIVGATGVLLIVCALFATPFFGLGGYTGPKSKRRGA